VPHSPPSIPLLGYICDEKMTHRHNRGGVSHDKLDM
jgi:hypothetical protein